MNAYTVSKLAHDAGISTDRVRQYAQRGLLQPCRCTGSGYRIYDETALTRLRFAIAGLEAGLSLDELAAFIQALDGADREVARRGFAMLERRIQRRIEKIARFQRQLDGLRAAARCSRNGRRPPGANQIKEEA